MDNLKIALVQADLIWEDKSANLEMMDSFLSYVQPNQDLIVLPETFSTGFAMKNVAHHAEYMDGPTVKWMKSKAAMLNAVITGSVMIQENGLYYNRMLWVEPDGGLSHYDKRHLFRLAYEQNYFSSGQSTKVVTLKGWKIRLNVCYDLRFPVWCRINNSDYDVLLFTANWPETRIHHWSALLKARAIENLSYVVGCNRIGLDGTGKNHTGDSEVVAPNGLSIAHGNKEEILYATLSHSDLQSTRNRFQFYKDADTFNLGK